MALYNLDLSMWYPITLPIQQASIVSIIVDDTGIMYLGGNMEISRAHYSVVSYEISTGIWDSLGQLPYGVYGNIVNTIALYTNENSEKFIFAAGEFSAYSAVTVPDNASVGLIFTQVTSEANEDWQVAGDSNLLYGAYYVASEENYII